MQIFWIVGESSSDAHAARLIQAIGRIKSGWRHQGMAGSAMREAGCKPIADISEASLMGLTEVIGHLPRMIRLRNRFFEKIASDRPDLVILMDFPDFNLALLKLIRKRLGSSIKVLYYISPQIWAWRRRRAKTMARLLDALAVIFPFEVDFFAKYGLETVFFGHPLVGEIGASASIEKLREEFSIREGQEAIALLPGSRLQEIRRHLPLLLQTVRQIRKKHPEIVALVTKVPTIRSEIYENYICNYPAGLGDRDQYSSIKLIDNRTSDILAVSRIGIIKSGTSTVEAALIGTPFCVMYRTSPLTYMLARLLVKGVRHIAMVNVLAGETIVPEFIQDDANVAQLAEAVEKLWEGEDRERVKAGLKRVREKLGEPHSSERLAEWLVRRFGEKNEG